MESLNEEWERLLAIVAHPDDLEYGASSAVARWRSQGKSVGYVVVTDGESGRTHWRCAETSPGASAGIGQMRS